MDSASDFIGIDSAFVGNVSEKCRGDFSKASDCSLGTSDSANVDSAESGDCRQLGDFSETSDYCFIKGDSAFFAKSSHSTQDSSANLGDFTQSATSLHLSRFASNIFAPPHISHLNPYFCELTALYFAYKHLDIDYYGLFHYRRLLDFSPCANANMQSIFYNRKDLLHKLNAESIENLCKHYDIILPAPFYDENFSMYSQYANCHHSKDLDACISYIKLCYPQMSHCISILYKCPASWHTCNMFVMKRELFFEYCEWLFSVLFGADICYKDYDSYQRRVFGFLSERLFNIWLCYKQNANPSLKVKTLPVIFLRFEPKNPLLRFFRRIFVRIFTKLKKIL